MPPIPDTAPLRAGASMPSAPPRENLYRAIRPGLELRASEDGGMPTLHGHFAVFNKWTEINSWMEGNFLERIAPGAMKKTFRERTPKVLFQHGQDPQIGDKPLGTVESLAEDATGAAYEVLMLDTAYNRDLIPGLEKGLYGASFRFKVMREELVEEPKASADNPKGLPERTIKEAQVMEFGPVTFPAYADATAGIRSLTDEVLLGRLLDDPEKLAQLIAEHHAGRRITVPREITAERSAVEEKNDAPGNDSAEQPAHPAEPRRDTKPTSKKEKQMSINEMRARMDEIRRELDIIARANEGEILPTDEQERWDAMEAEYADIEKRVQADESRAAYLERIAKDERHHERETPPDPDPVPPPERRGSTRVSGGRKVLPENIYDLAGYHPMSRSQDELVRNYTEGARRILDDGVFPNDNVDQARAKEHLDRLLLRESGSTDAELARRIIATGAPAYRRAFGKTLAKQQLSNEEQRAMATFTGSAGGFEVPYQLDPTIILSSSGAINPFRQISRVETVTSNEWRGITSTGITAAYAAEATAASDNSPTLVQPTLNPERAQAFVPFSFEIGQDWGSLESELARCFADAKDGLEATAFLTGAGHASNLPLGVLRASGTLVGTAANTAFAVGDLYAMEAALPPRFQTKARWLASRQHFQRIRQLDTAGGANLWVQLQNADPPELLGYPAHVISTMGGTALTSGASYAIFGDFSQFLIIDRIGMSVNFIPFLFGGTAAFHPPTGESGLFAMWRNTSGVTTSNAFRTGTIT